jgi:hypothetical protein
VHNSLQEFHMFSQSLSSQSALHARVDQVEVAVTVATAAVVQVDVAVAN